VETNRNQSQEFVTGYTSLVIGLWSLPKSGPAAPNMARIMSIHSGSTLQRIGQRHRGHDQLRLFVFNEIQP